MQSLLSLLLLASSISAAPVTPESVESKLSLEKRGGAVVYDDSCNGDIPSGGKYPAAGFKTMKDVVQQAFTDTQTLASKAQSVAVDNKGFTHYFKANELDNFDKMMGAIASSDTDKFSIKFVCVPKLGKDIKTDCTKTSAATTDASNGGHSDQKVIEICPAFFTGSDTAYLLYDPKHTKPSPPYKDDTGDGWCAKSRRSSVSKDGANKFVTAAHSLLHELTHLDALGTIAGIPENKLDDQQVHGTRDLNKLSSPLTAREVLVDYHPPTTPEIEAPIINAESYAAAATEIYFMDLCKFSEISPIVGAGAQGGGIKTTPGAPGGGNVTAPGAPVGGNVTAAGAPGGGNVTAPGAPVGGNVTTVA